MRFNEQREVLLSVWYTLEANFIRRILSGVGRLIDFELNGKIGVADGRSVPQHVTLMNFMSSILHLQSTMMAHQHRGGF